MRSSNIHAPSIPTDLQSNFPPLVVLPHAPRADESSLQSTHCLPLIQHTAPQRRRKRKRIVAHSKRIGRVSWSANSMFVGRSRTRRCFPPTNRTVQIEHGWEKTAVFLVKRILYSQPSCVKEKTCHKGVGKEKLPLGERGRGFQRLFALVLAELRGHEEPHCAVLRIDSHVCNKHFLFFPVHEEREKLAGRRGEERINRPIHEPFELFVVSEIEIVSIEQHMATKLAFILTENAREVFWNHADSVLVKQTKRHKSKQQRESRRRIDSWIEFIHELVRIWLKRAHFDVHVEFTRRMFSNNLVSVTQGIVVWRWRTVIANKLIVVTEFGFVEC